MIVKQVFLKLVEINRSNDPTDPTDPPKTETDKESLEEDCLTFRALFVGLLIGCLVAAMNVNFGLRTG